MRSGSSDRNFGITVGAALLLIALRSLYRSWTRVHISLLILSIALFLVSLLRPSLLRPLNQAWTALGSLMAHVVNPVVLSSLYFLVVTPVSITLRIRGKDPLRLRRDVQAYSYWIERTPPGPSPESMTHQF